MGKHNLWGLNDTEQAIWDRIASGNASEEDKKALAGLIDKVHTASNIVQQTILARTTGKKILSN